MLKAVIMDFDGLIIDTEVVWYDIFKQWFLENLGYELPLNEFLVCVGADSSVLFRQLEAAYPFSIDRHKFKVDTHDMFIEKSNQLPIKDGVLEFIKCVKASGIALGMGTSAGKKKIDAQLERLNLRHYFDQIITGEDVEQIKPCPDIFLKSLELLQVDNEEALIVEDSLNGLIAGNNAKIKVLVVPNAVTQSSDFKGCYMKMKELNGACIEKIKADYRV